MRRVLRLAAVNFAVLSSLLVAFFFLIPLLNGFLEVGRDESIRQAALPNYRQADWALEHFREFNRLDTEYRAFVGWRRASFAGETIVIEGPFGERRTPLPTEAAEPSVYFFGGSAMWGTGARDQDTIPALYAAATNRVARNFGESAYIAHQNLEMLLWLLQSGARPSAVVFYDGVNDVLQKCRRGHNLFSHAQEGRIADRMNVDYDSLRYFAIPLLQTLPGEADVLGSDCDDDPAKARAVAQSLLLDWETARAVAEAHGIRFYAVLQPVIYLSETRRDHLRAAVPEGRRRQFDAVYPLVRAELAARGFADFTAMLNRDEYIYIDIVHVSPNGNALIAQALAELVD